MNRFGYAAGGVRQRTRATPEVVNAFMRGVYAWMSGGLAITALVAWYGAQSQFVMQNILGSGVGLIGLVIGQFALVIVLSAAVHKLAPAMASGLFLLYSGMMGLLLATIFYVYPMGDIFKAFITTAGMFGAMSVYGLTTKKDLTSWGSFLMMGLFGIIIAMVVNIFLQSAAMDFVISGIGVVVFTGLTAYDTQQLRVMGDVAPDDQAAVQRATINGALRLYLDFINLFIMLLSLFSGGRE
ncbi:Bax inhibitor-1/YccA family protein [Desulfohalovibrio reitneri]|uniref:Bax inhibitor-1/YccA family protein n=1 Tax=Desulfohalovibrio reitneri TaxID=1307759 RepID=UPI000557F3CB|nr:Bax inhibitor-1/YccA family protein [Desulfohalovibrio reitneri]